MDFNLGQNVPWSSVCARERRSISTALRMVLGSISVELLRYKTFSMHRLFFDNIYIPVARLLLSSSSDIIFLSSFIF
jgi:hypothetical protein